MTLVRVLFYNAVIFVCLFSTKQSHFDIARKNLHIFDSIGTEDVVASAKLFFSVTCNFPK